MRIRLIILMVFFSISLISLAQSANNDSIVQSKQYPGLGKAASSIFFSEKPWSISGFGEINHVATPGFTPDREALDDIELYYNNLYRLAIFFGYRFTQKFIINSEIQIEYLSANSDGHTELNFELFADYRYDPAFNLRLGFHPLGIGYINSNDEPILFYSVNRPESERIILPSTWIELGAAAYGKFNDDFSYFASLVSGLDAQHFKSATWVRNGREAFDLNSLAIVGQINYSTSGVLDLNLSAYYGSNGNHSYQFENKNYDLNSNLTLLSGYLRYSPKNFRFLLSGNYGWLSDTNGIYQLTKAKNGNGEVLGKKAFGIYSEFGVDLLHWFWWNRKSIEKRLIDTHEMKLPIFVRLEHLNTHKEVEQELIALPRVQNYMTILAIGTNFNFTEDIVLKANYQFRNSHTSTEFAIPTGNYIELGLGFNF